MLLNANTNALTLYLCIISFQFTLCLWDSSLFMGVAPDHSFLERWLSILWWIFDSLFFLLWAMLSKHAGYIFCSTNFAWVWSKKYCYISLCSAPWGTAELFPRWCLLVFLWAYENFSQPSLPMLASIRHFQFFQLRVQNGISLWFCNNDSFIEIRFTLHTILGCNVYNETIFSIFTVEQLSLQSI